MGPNQWVWRASGIHALGRILSLLVLPEIESQSLLAFQLGYRMKKVAVASPSLLDNPDSIPATDSIQDWLHPHRLILQNIFSIYAIVASMDSNHFLTKA